MTKLSTADVARRIGINRVTLERWISDGKISAPGKVKFGKSEFRNWTPADVERVRKYKQENYGKGKGRKPKPKR